MYRVFNRLVDNTPPPRRETFPRSRCRPNSVKALKDRVEAFRKAVDDGTPTEPLVLTSDDLNALIEDNAELKGMIYVKIEGDEVKGQVSLPLDKLNLRHGPRPVLERRSRFQGIALGRRLDRHARVGRGQRPESPRGLHDGTSQAKPGQRRLQGREDRRDESASSRAWKSRMERSSQGSSQGVARRSHEESPSRSAPKERRSVNRSKVVTELRSERFAPRVAAGNQPRRGAAPTPAESRGASRPPAATSSNEAFLAISTKIAEHMDSLQGHLLIASPGLADPNFARTVVLIAVHGEEGALGLILNREMNTPLDAGLGTGQRVGVPADRKRAARRARQRQLDGGARPAAARQPGRDRRDLRRHRAQSAMESLAGSEQGQALFYVGHSGWGPGQLETELADGSWLVLPAARRAVFGDHDTNALWKETMTEVGRRQVQSVIPVKHVPDNPRLN